MKKKIILGTGMGVLVLLVVGVIVAGFFLGDIVKAGMETFGPKITQTTLTVDAVNVSLLGGSAGVKGLVLGNPAGYKAPSAISVGKATVSISLGSLLSDKIVIRSIEVRDAEITFEGNPLGANNLAKLRDNVNALTASADQAVTNAPTGAKQPAKKLEVDDFLLTGAKVHANITGFINREITLTLPDIHLTNLGQGSDGITAPDLTKKVLDEITTGTITALVGAVADLGKGMTGAAKGAVQGAAKGADKLKSGLGSLFGK